MANNTMHFSEEKVKAHLAYFQQSRKSAKGKPEYGDLETTVKICEQLLALMEGRKKPEAVDARASSEH